MLRWTSTLPLAVLLTGACATVAPLRASLCEIIETPSQFDGATVAVEAQLVWAMPHPVYLRDASCDAGGVILVYDMDHAGVREIFDAIRADPRNVFASFTGEVLTQHDGERGLYLRLLSVRNVDSAPR